MVECVTLHHSGTKWNINEMVMKHVHSCDVSVLGSALLVNVNVNVNVNVIVNEIGMQVAYAYPLITRT